MREGPDLSRLLPREPRNRTMPRIPGSHTLYVGPRGCLRRHALRAFRRGERGSVSFLQLPEEDLVSGAYEERIVAGAAELLRRLSTPPGILFIALFCADDFLGTDEKALLERLRDACPGCRFAVERLGPVSLSEKRSMGEGRQLGLYAFLEPPEERDGGVNLLGSYAPLPEDTEFFSLLGDWGLGPVRALFACGSYEEYQALARSRINIVLRPNARAAAAALEERLGIPAFELYPEYDASAVLARYERLASLLGRPCPDFSTALAAISQEANLTAEALRDLPIALDAAASLLPFQLAKALLGYGLRVRQVFRTPGKLPFDPASEAWIRERHPEIEIADPKAAARPALPAGTAAVLALGKDAARLTGAKYTLDMWHDEGYFGFQGIFRLLRELREAVGGA